MRYNVGLWIGIGLIGLGVTYLLISRSDKGVEIIHRLFAWNRLGKHYTRIDLIGRGIILIATGIVAVLMLWHMYR